MIVASNVGSIQGPIWGALSDTAVSPSGRRRRRPFVIAGQVLFSVACFSLMEAKTFHAFLLSYMLWTFTATLSGAPYTAIYTESICMEQRGFFNAVQSWQSLFVGFAVSALGVALGEHLIRCETPCFRKTRLFCYTPQRFAKIGLGQTHSGFSPSWGSLRTATTPATSSQSLSATSRRSHSGSWAWASHPAAGLRSRTPRWRMMRRRLRRRRGGHRPQSGLATWPSTLCQHSSSRRSGGCSSPMP
jgi:MFS family permease|eukprot:COSAG06_NODE_7875_length_2346_cov_1.788607_3_plen_245_part_00